MFLGHILFSGKFLWGTDFCGFADQPGGVVRVGCGQSSKWHENEVRLKSPTAYPQKFALVKISRYTVPYYPIQLLPPFTSHVHNS